jgi:DNA replication protein
MSFEGFPVRTQFTPVPELFINRIAQGLSREELRLMLVIFNTLYNKKGYPRYTTEAELSAHPALADIKNAGDLLEAMAGQGILLALPGNADNPVLYCINNPEGQKVAAAAGKGNPGVSVSSAPKLPPAPHLPDIFTSYEENIGLITPMIAEELKDALKTYREDWIHDAIKEAVALNKRSLRYVQRILERWTAEGRNNNGAHRPDNDPDKYIRGRYGGLVQR